MDREQDNADDLNCSFVDRIEETEEFPRTTIVRHNRHVISVTTTSSSSYSSSTSAINVDVLHTSFASSGYDSVSTLTSPVGSSLTSPVGSSLASPVDSSLVSPDGDSGGVFYTDIAARGDLTLHAPAPLLSLEESREDVERMPGDGEESFDQKDHDDDRAPGGGGFVQVLSRPPSTNSTTISSKTRKEAAQRHPESNKNEQEEKLVKADGKAAQETRDDRKEVKENVFDKQEQPPAKGSSPPQRKYASELSFPPTSPRTGEYKPDDDSGVEDEESDGRGSKAESVGFFHCEGAHQHDHAPCGGYRADFHCAYCNTMFHRSMTPTHWDVDLLASVTDTNNSETEHFQSTNNYGFKYMATRQMRDPVLLASVHSESEKHSKLVDINEIALVTIVRSEYGVKVLDPRELSVNRTLYNASVQYGTEDTLEYLEDAVDDAENSRRPVKTRATSGLDFHDTEDGRLLRWHAPVTVTSGTSSHLSELKQSKLKYATKVEDLHVHSACKNIDDLALVSLARSETGEEEVVGPRDVPLRRPFTPEFFSNEQTLVSTETTFQFENEIQFEDEDDVFGEGDGRRELNYDPLDGISEKKPILKPSRMSSRLSDIDEVSEDYDDDDDSSTKVSTCFCSVDDYTPKRASDFWERRQVVQTTVLKSILVHKGLLRIDTSTLENEGCHLKLLAVDGEQNEQQHNSQDYTVRITRQPVTEEITEPEKKKTEEERRHTFYKVYFFDYEEGFELTELEEVSELDDPEQAHRPLVMTAESSTTPPAKLTVLQYHASPITEPTPSSSKPLNIAFCDSYRVYGHIPYEPEKEEEIAVTEQAEGIESIHEVDMATSEKNFTESTATMQVQSHEFVEQQDKARLEEGEGVHKIHHQSEMATSENVIASESTVEISHSDTPTQEAYDSVVVAFPSDEQRLQQSDVSFSEVDRAEQYLEEKFPDSFARPRPASSMDVPVGAGVVNEEEEEIEEHIEEDEEKEEEEIDRSEHLIAGEEEEEEEEKETVETEVEITAETEDSQFYNAAEDEEEEEQDEEEEKEEQEDTFDTEVETKVGDEDLQDDIAVEEKEEEEEEEAKEEQEDTFKTGEEEEGDEDDVNDFHTDHLKFSEQESAASYKADSSILTTTVVTRDSSVGASLEEATSLSYPGGARLDDVDGLQHSTQNDDVTDSGTTETATSELTDNDDSKTEGEPSSYWLTGPGVFPHAPDLMTSDDGDVSVERVEQQVKVDSRPTWLKPTEKVEPLVLPPGPELNVNDNNNDNNDIQDDTTVGADGKAAEDNQSLKVVDDVTISAPSPHTPDEDLSYTLDDIFEGIVESDDDENGKDDAHAAGDDVKGSGDDESEGIEDVVGSALLTDITEEEDEDEERRFSQTDIVTKTTEDVTHTIDAHRPNSHTTSLTNTDGVIVTKSDITEEEDEDEERNFSQTDIVTKTTEDVTRTTDAHGHNSHTTSLTNAEGVIVTKSDITKEEEEDEERRFSQTEIVTKTTEDVTHTIDAHRPNSHTTSLTNTDGVIATQSDITEEEEEDEESRFSQTDIVTKTTEDVTHTIHAHRPNSHTTSLTNADGGTLRLEESRTQSQVSTDAAETVEGGSTEDGGSGMGDNYPIVYAQVEVTESNVGVKSGTGDAVVTVTANFRSQNDDVGVTTKEKQEVKDTNAAGIIVKSSSQDSKVAVSSTDDVNRTVAGSGDVTIKAQTSPQGDNVDGSSWFKTGPGVCIPPPATDGDENSGDVTNNAQTSPQGDDVDGSSWWKTGPGVCVPPTTDGDENKDDAGGVVTSANTGEHSGDVIDGAGGAGTSVSTGENTDDVRGDVGGAVTSVSSDYIKDDAEGAVTSVPAVGRYRDVGRGIRRGDSAVDDDFDAWAGSRFRAFTKYLLVGMRRVFAGGRSFFGELLGLFRSRKRRRALFYRREMICWLFLYFLLLLLPLLWFFLFPYCEEDCFFRNNLRDSATFMLVHKFGPPPV